MKKLTRHNYVHPPKSGAYALGTPQMVTKPMISLDFFLKKKLKNTIFSPFFLKKSS